MTEFRFTHLLFLFLFAVCLVVHDADGQGVETSNKEKLSSVKVEFTSLAAPQFATFTVRPDGSKRKVGGATSHTGVVTVTPASARSEVQLRLVQYVNSTVSTGPVAQSQIDETYSGHDSDYAGLTQNVSSTGSDQITITCGDNPGPSFAPDTWMFGLTTNVENTVSIAMSFNLYMQFKVGDGQWKTRGKVTWGINGSATYKRVVIDGFNALVFTEAPGTVTSGTGSASTEAPKAP